MPRRKRPLPLFNLCLRSIASAVINTCKRGNDVNSMFVSKIPPALANHYMASLIQTHADVENTGIGLLDLRPAIHPDCTQLIFDHEEYYNSHRSSVDLIRLQVLKNLDAMPKLSMLRCGRFTETDIADATLFTIKNIPKLAHLTSVNLGNIRSPYAVAMLAKHCPDLEDIVANRYIMRKSRIKILAKCSKLKSFHFNPWTTDLVSPEACIFLLEMLPDLESLGIQMLQDFLELCQKPYPLKSLKGYVKAPTDMSLVAKYLPQLESLELVGSAALSFHSINDLRHLKKLAVLGKAREDNVDLMVTFSRLTELSLTNNYSSLFTSILSSDNDVSFPQLSSLSLDACSSVDLAALSRLFPDLKRLLFNYCSFADPPLYPKSILFRNILYLKSRTSKDDATRHLSTLLSSCYDLEQLDLTQPYLDCALMKELIKINPLKKLTSLTLHCIPVNDDPAGSTIPALLDTCDSLETLNLDKSEVWKEWCTAMDIKNWLQLDVCVSGEHL